MCFHFNQFDHCYLKPVVRSSDSILQISIQVANTVIGAPESFNRWKADKAPSKLPSCGCGNDITVAWLYLTWWLDGIFGCLDRPKHQSWDAKEDRAYPNIWTTSFFHFILFSLTLVDVWMEKNRINTGHLQEALSLPQLLMIRAWRLESRPKDASCSWLEAQVSPNTPTLDSTWYLIQLLKRLRCR